VLGCVLAPLDGSALAARALGHAAALAGARHGRLLLLPPGYYVLVHPDAQLSVTERQMLMSGLATLSGGPTRQRGTDD
jgi:nucleotide-binding universal stress UspA family protein